MEGFLDYRKDPEAYVYAKVYDSLIEGRLALEMLRRGLLQNAASKGSPLCVSVVIIGSSLRGPLRSGFIGHRVGAP
uniref:hypothetical protein n=1 Tax=Vulcanisaeta sp. JCM 14467 TaxID=1295370 RepID=UPI0006CFC2A3|nr:hypothetical protein [Vulcanisaeta sp. JCM 14467]